MLFILNHHLKIQKKNKIKYGNTYINEINKTYNESYKFNENGIIRETRNYILYENKNWTENIQSLIEYDKIELPPPPTKPKPKPKSKIKKYLKKSSSYKRRNRKRRR